MFTTRTPDYPVREIVLFNVFKLLHKHVQQNVMTCYYSFAYHVILSMNRGRIVLTPFAVSQLFVNIVNLKVSLCV